MVYDVKCSSEVDVNEMHPNTREKTSSVINVEQRSRNSKTFVGFMKKLFSGAFSTLSTTVLYRVGILQRVQASSGGSVDAVLRRSLPPLLPKI